MPSAIPRPRPITIAHRGACGYLPEHSLAAKAMAHAMGAEFLEQDLVATRDDQLVVLHDIHIDRVTNVTEHFATRHRDDGRFYARDFTLDEIKQLRLTERTDASGRVVFGARYPGGVSGLSVASFAEELAMVRGLNRSTSRIAGVYPEIKKPQWHHDEGVDVSQLALSTLRAFGYEDKPEQVWLQCFDLAENTRLAESLQCPYRQVQLIADDAWGESATCYAELLAPGGLLQLQGVVAAIGPWLEQLYSLNPDGRVIPTSLVADAATAGLCVHPYTVRADALPPGFNSMSGLLDWLLEQGVDGVFCDFTDQCVSHFDARALAPAATAFKR